MKIRTSLLICSLLLCFVACEEDGPKINRPKNLEKIDLGLPSGLLWASCNLGAEKPTDYGDFYAWGEVKTKPLEDYTWEKYKYCEGTNRTLTKYCTQSDYGTVDNKTELEPMDDAATVNWGKGWRTPTKDEWEELFEHCECVMMMKDGHFNGFKLRSKKNGNSIFLPPAGIYGDADWGFQGNFGYYLSATLNKNNPDGARGLSFLANGLYFFAGVNESRADGRSVRPVYDGNAAGTTGSGEEGGEDAKQQYTVTIEVNDSTMGSVTGMGTYEQNDTITIAATPHKGHIFKQWSDGVTDNPRTMIVTADVTIKAIFEQIDQSQFIYKKNGYTAIDLSLPSQTLWATYNIGASQPEQYGEYYAWGEIETKQEYSLSTYKLSNTGAKYNKEDGKTTLETADDVASHYWGKPWRMPTKEEMQELLTHCIWKETTVNNVRGYEFTSKAQDNCSSLFLPHAGFVDYINLMSAGYMGLYWTSSLEKNDTRSKRAHCLVQKYGQIEVTYTDRFYGYSIRPVCKKYDM